MRPASLQSGRPSAFPGRGVRGPVCPCAEVAALAEVETCALMFPEVAHRPLDGVKTKRNTSSQTLLLSCSKVRHNILALILLVICLVETPYPQNYLERGLECYYFLNYMETLFNKNQRVDSVLQYKAGALEERLVFSS